ncbi:MAG TPA: helix-turn-helix transcriptional regulator, partial [Candidatus Dormibacteraeota bacterium]|nr:helix-turn-helix transcriptional regulator [Candidatus Dormibacteraeota bacterium]
ALVVAVSAEIRTAFGRAVRFARLRRGMRQLDLAEAADVNRRTISLIERGFQDPSLSIQERIARALGLTPAQLLEAADQERERIKAR